MSPTPTPYRAASGKVTWQVRFRIDGAPNPVKETFGTQAEADKFCRLVERVGGTAARATRRTGEDSSRTMPTLATWLETHLAQLAASATPGTVADYRRMAARTWLPRLGMLPLDAVTRHAVVEWIGWQRQQTARGGKPYAPKSIANAHGLLSTVLQSAVDADIITRNVAKGAPLPSDAERGEMVILTENEATSILDALPDYWRPLVALLLGTGLRWGEATALTPADLDLDATTPILRVTRAWKKGETGVYLGSPKTRRGRRTVALPDWLVPILREQVQGKSSDGLLFTGKQGGRVQAQHFRERVWAPALERSGVGKRPRVHDLRHTHASWMIASGIDMLTLQHRLGHESLKTTGDTYGHLLPDAHVRSARHASGMLSGAFPQIEAAPVEA